MVVHGASSQWWKSGPKTSYFPLLSRRTDNICCFCQHADLCCKLLLGCSSQPQSFNTSSTLPHKGGLRPLLSAASPVRADQKRDELSPPLLISEEWMILLLIQMWDNSSLSCDSFCSEGLITRVAAPPALPRCWPGIWRNIIAASEWANIVPEHLIGDDVDEWLIATSSLIEAHQPDMSSQIICGLSTLNAVSLGFETTGSQVVLCRCTIKSTSRVLSDLQAHTVWIRHYSEIFLYCLEFL